MSETVKSLLKTGEQAYHREEISDCRGSSAATCKAVKGITPKKRESNNSSFENETAMAEKFNEFFVTVGKRTFQTTQNDLKDASQSYDNPQHYVTHEHFFRPPPVDMNTVILTIKRLQKTTSAGSDDITLQCLQDSLPSTIPYITTIINTSIVTGKFLAIWKQATVIPIFKNGDKTDIKNYRPISLPPILSKILEKKNNVAINCLPASRLRTTSLTLTAASDRNYQQRPP